MLFRTPSKHRVVRPERASATKHLSIHAYLAFVDNILAAMLAHNAMTMLTDDLLQRNG